MNIKKSSHLDETCENNKDILEIVEGVAIEISDSYITDDMRVKLIVRLMTTINGGDTYFSFEPKTKDQNKNINFQISSKKNGGIERIHVFIGNNSSVVEAVDNESQLPTTLRVVEGEARLVNKRIIDSIVVALKAHKLIQ